MSDMTSQDAAAHLVPMGRDPAKLGLEKTKEKLKRGEKRINGEVVTPEEFNRLFVRRVIFLPILKPITDGVGWKELGDAMNECFRETCRMANLAMRLYATSDTEHPTGTTGKMKLSKWKPNSTVYHKCRELCPEHPSGSVSDLCQRLQGIYAKSRFEMLVTCRKSLPSFTSGRLPICIRAQDWKSGRSADGDLLCEFTLSSRGASARPGRITVVLRRHNHERHAKVYEQIVAGEIQAADLKIKPCKEGYGIAVTVNLPRRTVEKSETVLGVRTDPSSLLVWRVGADEERPPLHADQLRNMIVAQDAQRQRWSDDLKFEKRYPAHVRRRMIHRRSRSLRGWENRRVNAIREAARLTVNFALRRGASKIIYDDSERTFVPRFAWAELSTAIANAAAVEGIEFVAAPAGPKGGQGDGPAKADNRAVAQSPEPSATVVDHVAGETLTSEKKALNE